MARLPNNPFDSLPSTGDQGGDFFGPPPPIQPGLTGGAGNGTAGGGEASNPFDSTLSTAATKPANQQWYGSSLPGQDFGPPPQGSYDPLPSSYGPPPGQDFGPPPPPPPPPPGSFGPGDGGGVIDWTPHDPPALGGGGGGDGPLGGSGGGLGGFTDAYYNQNPTFAMSAYQRARGIDSNSAQGRWLASQSNREYAGYGAASAVNPSLNYLPYLQGDTGSLNDWWGVNQAGLMSRPPRGH